MGAMCTGVIGLRAFQDRNDSSFNRVAYFADRSHGAVPLMRAEIFTSLKIGYSGEISPLATQFRNLLESPSAESELERLVRNGSAGARLFGLCGLRLKGSARYDLLCQLASRDERMTAVQHGCGLSIGTVREALGTRNFKDTCADLATDLELSQLPNQALNPVGLGPAG